MSKNIVIQESGTAQTLNTISFVETRGKDGHGSVDWVPEDETTLGEVTITANTEVKASDKGYYAFSKVNVKSNGKAVGKKNGQWVVVSRDPNGRLVTHGLPTKILVVTPPTKTSYASGEAIDLTGIVVKAYYSDDSEYGKVYNKNLTITPKTATGTTITVKWKRDGDKHVLSTTFSITIDQ